MDSLALLAWGPTGWGDKLAAGAAITITLSLATLPLGLAAGFFVALGKQSTDPLIKLSANVSAREGIYRSLVLLAGGGTLTVRSITATTGQWSADIPIPKSLDGLTLELVDGAGNVLSTTVAVGQDVAMGCPASSAPGAAAPTATPSPETQPTPPPRQPPHR